MMEIGVWDSGFGLAMMGRICSVWEFVRRENWEGNFDDGWNLRA